MIIIISLHEKIKSQKKWQQQQKNKLIYKRKFNYIRMVRFNLQMRHKNSLNWFTLYSLWTNISNIVTILFWFCTFCAFFVFLFVFILFDFWIVNSWNVSISELFHRFNGAFAFTFNANNAQRFPPRPVSVFLDTFDFIFLFFLVFLFYYSFCSQKRFKREFAHYKIDRLEKQKYCNKKQNKKWKKKNYL